MDSTRAPPDLRFISRRRLAHRLCLLLSTFVIASCGGGSGGDSAAGLQVPPKSINGAAMLGAVQGADVEVFGTNGSLGTGSTDAQGRFGPIDLPGTYNGPLRIEVSATPGSGSIWTCDSFIGCPIGGVFFAFGDEIAFDGPVNAVVASAIDGQTINVSLLSHMVVERAEVLGGFTEANVTQADADIIVMLNALLGSVFSGLCVTLPDSLSSVDLFDMNDLPAPTGDQDSLRTALTLMNGSWMAMNSSVHGTGALVRDIGRKVAEQPDLPVNAGFSMIRVRIIS